jgi:hypothetical protein
MNNIQDSIIEDNAAPSYCKDIIIVETEEVLNLIYEAGVSKGAIKDTDADGHEFLIYPIFINKKKTPV